MNQDPSNPPWIDDATVQRYWDGAGGDAAAMSMMAHEHNLPARAGAYRLRVDTVPEAGKALDVGCGAGTWVRVFGGGDGGEPISP